jgi:hypothetical protein
MPARRHLTTLDSYANDTYGRSISSAVASGTCVRCSTKVEPFATTKAGVEYARDGLCDGCRSRAAKLLEFSRKRR